MLAFLLPFLLFSYCSYLKYVAFISETMKKLIQKGKNTRCYIEPNTFSPTRKCREREAPQTMGGRRGSGERVCTLSNAFDIGLLLLLLLCCTVELLLFGYYCCFSFRKLINLFFFKLFIGGSYRTRKMKSNKRAVFTILRVYGSFLNGK